MTTIGRGTAGLDRPLHLAPRPPHVADPPAAVSVVIPCYNYARFLGAAVRSVLSQAGVSVEVVVVDDASTDDSRAQAQALADVDPRVKVVRHRTNRGPVVTFNDGLAEVTGEFVVRLDADDLLTPGSLHRSVALARAFPSVGLVYGHPLHFAGSMQPSARQRVRSWTVWPGREWLRARCRSGLNVITSPEVLMRRTVVDLVGGQQPLAHTHDMEMWFRIAAFSDVGHLEGSDQAWHREHAASLSAREVDPMLDLFGRRDAFEVLFGGVVGNVDGAGRMLEDARTALAREALIRACHEFDRGRADPHTTAALVAFANEVQPGAPCARERRALERRIALGARAVGRHPLYVGAAVRRRLVDTRDYRHWARWGVYRRD